LSIVLRIVQLLNVHLDVRSEVAKGSTFSLVLPSSSGRVAPTASTSATAPAQRTRELGALVLLVEDDPAVQAATKMLLKVAGYRVMIAATQAEALKLAREQPLDLLITDYHLAAGETGLEVIAQLRGALQKPLKAVLMTGDTSSAIQGLDADAGVRIVSKPIQAEELLALMASLLQEVTPAV